MATQKKTPGRNNFKYRPRFGVIVICTDEVHQQVVFEQFKQLGYKPKVVNV